MEKNRNLDYRFSAKINQDVLLYLYAVDRTKLKILRLRWHKFVLISSGHIVVQHVYACKHEYWCSKTVHARCNTLSDKYIPGRVESNSMKIFVGEMGLWVLRSFSNIDTCNYVIVVNVRNGITFHSRNLLSFHILPRLPGFCSSFNCKFGTWIVWKWKFVKTIRVDTIYL